MNFIKSYCQIIPGQVWLNEKKYFTSDRELFVMDHFFHDLYRRTGIDYRKFHKMDALSKLGFLASEILLAGTDREHPKPDMGILFFNRSSSLEADINFQLTIQDKENFFPSPAEFVYTLPNIVAGEIAIRNKIYGETVFYTLPVFDSHIMCSTIDDAMCYAGIKYALAGWIEIDVFSNELYCLMMLCTSKQGKTTIEKSESYLPKKTDDIYYERSYYLHADYVNDLFEQVNII